MSFITEPTGGTEYCMLSMCRWNCSFFHITCLCIRLTSVCFVAMGRFLWHMDAVAMATGAGHVRMSQVSDLILRSPCICTHASN